MSNLDPTALAWRGIRPDEACTLCAGTGSRWYASTSTWRGGQGGSRSTRDVCDVCWGSGDRTRPWVDLRALRAGEDARVAERAATFLADLVGGGLTVVRVALRLLAVELLRASRRRGEVPPFYRDAALALSKALDRMADDPSVP